VRDNHLFSSSDCITRELDKNFQAVCFELCQQKTFESSEPKADNCRLTADRR
jgi:hypothetical protein